jgi:hypothetical protein
MQRERNPVALLITVYAFSQSVLRKSGPCGAAEGQELRSQNPFESGYIVLVFLPFMADGLSDLYRDLLTGSYDCVDRIVLNAYSAWGMVRRVSLVVAAVGRFGCTLDNAHLMRMAGRFSRRIRGQCESAWNPGDRLFSRAAQARSGGGTVGQDEDHTRIVSCPDRSRSKARMGREPKSSHRAQEAHALCKPLLVSHPRSGLGAYHDQNQRAPSVSRPRILNGHEYIACQARKAAIDFTKEENFLLISLTPQAWQRSQRPCPRDGL